MSLINKMLQDLDARGGAGEDAVHQQEVKAVPVTERDRRPLLIGGAAAGVLVLAAGGWYGWQYWQSHSAPPPGPAPKIVDNRPPRTAVPAAGQPGSAPAPTSATGSQPGATPVSAVGSHRDATPASAVGSHQDAALASTKLPTDAATPQLAHSTPVSIKSPVDASTPQLADSAPEAAKPARAAVERAPRVLRASSSAATELAAPSEAARERKAASAAKSEGVVVRELTPKQMSENSYRRALAALQEGRINAALADLDKAVEIDPRNDAARQTYVSLLLENRRTDDAIRQLRLALGIDARQPGLAIILARLQLEKGGPALDTLLKTLPYAGNNAEYLGFLAGVLQREQRHAEAAEQYRNALAIAPDNAIWWMGLGISLQADQHLPEAREAYRHARSGIGLTPELKSFVDRKLDQLSR